MLKIWGVLAVLILVFLAKSPPTHYQFVSPTPLQDSPHALLERHTLDPPPVKSVHASSLVALSSHFLLAAYFGGSAEAQSDVRLYAHLYTLKTQRWSKPFSLLDAPTLSQLAGIYIKALGNPVLLVHHGHLYLFVVGVSLGGWATSRIYQLSAPLIATPQSPIWRFERVLPLSPFLNISHLVRHSAVLTTDGGFILPIYHELAAKFALLLKFDARARLQAIIKPNTLTAQFQPALIPYESCAFMAFRSHKDHKLYTQTCQTPTLWNPPQASNLANYDDALALFSTKHHLYLIYNAPLLSSLHSRSALRLARFSAPNHFTPVAILDQSLQGEVSYPCVLVLGDRVHVLYTKDRHAIVHVSFNSTYLKGL
ncbi:exo-alpha-sialidase [Helicobacter labacensis]|uniref:exo-alpha-sialidase n=1 Tax=Helicobacter labacensis TaxID=2316079 RepID=UPI000EB4FEAD|nr:sialidase family protein [Helicobacter labacensis]